MKSVLVVCLALVALEMINAQVIRSLSSGLISNGCGCGCNTLSSISAIPPCSNSIIAQSPCSSNIISPAPISTNIIAPIAPISSILAPIASPCSPNIIAPAPISSTIIAAQPSVAASLADTLSLLTVSSLLAETLPLGSNVVVAPPCGLGMGYGGYFY